MKKLLTKLSAFIIAAALVLSSVSTVFAKNVTDYFTVSGEIKCGDTKNIMIETDGDKLYYKFVPTESQIYVITSDATDTSVDPFVSLYNSNFIFINDNDDGGDGSNFRMDFYAVAGKTYYFGIKSFGVGNFNVTLDKSDIGKNLTEIKSGDTKTFKIENAGDNAYYKFTPEKTDAYVIASDTGNNKSIDPAITLMDSNLCEIVSADNTLIPGGGNDNNFELEFTAFAGKTYYFKVCSLDGSSNQEFNVTLKNNQKEIKSGDTKTVVINEECSEVFYKFQPAETGIYNIISKRDAENDELDPRIYLYDDQFVRIDSCDDRLYDEDLDFELNLGVKAGKTYYLKFIANSTDVSTGVYDVELKKSDFTGDIKSGETKTVDVKAHSAAFYYKFTPTETGCYVLNSNSGEDHLSIDPWVAVYDKNFEWIDYNDDGGIEFEFQLEFDATAGETYYIEVYTRKDNCQFDFTLEKHYFIKHQPSSGEPYVDFSWDDNAEYQWYTVSMPKTEITDKNASALDNEYFKSTYNSSTGWSAENIQDTYYCGFFELPLKKGEKITVELLGKATGIELYKYDTNGYYYFDCYDTSIYELTVPEDGEYAFYIHTYDKDLTFKAYLGGITYNKIDGQADKTLTKYNLNEKYACKVKSNNTEYVSKIFNCEYAIIHQPTEKELYVKPNIDNGTEYQWYQCKRTTLEITDKNADIIDDFYESLPSSYDATTGWSGHRSLYVYEETVTEDDSSMFFSVNLKKGDEIKFEINGYLETIGISTVDSLYYDDAQPDANNCATLIAPADGEYYVSATCDDDTVLKAYLTHYEFTEVKGETDAELKNGEKGKIYACKATFADDTTEMSEVVTLTKDIKATVNNTDDSKTSPKTGYSVELSSLLLTALCPMSFWFKSKKRA